MLMYRVFWSCVVILGITACSQQTDTKKQFYGNAQGTTYQVSYYGSNTPLKLQRGIDSLLLRLDYALSNYRPQSQISALNESTDTLFTLVDSCGFWKQVWKISEVVHQQSQGAFDPSIYPLVKAYGFGPNQRPQLDSTANLDSLKALVDFKEWKLTSGPSNQITITKPLAAQLDFNAVAQGMAVDLMTSFLQEQGITSYFVELGGEVKVGDKKPTGDFWVLGIEKPQSEEKRVIQDTIHVANIAIATSGSNRKFYEANGKRYSHTIDAITGLPVSHEILSVTVKNPSCAYADAWATTALVLGDRAPAMFEKNKLEAPILIR